MDTHVSYGVMMDACELVLKTSITDTIRLDVVAIVPQNNTKRAASRFYKSTTISQERRIRHDDDESVDDACLVWHNWLVGSSCC